MSWRVARVLAYAYDWPSRLRLLSRPLVLLVEMTLLWDAGPGGSPTCPGWISSIQRVILYVCIEIEVIVYAYDRVRSIWNSFGRIALPAKSLISS